MDVMEVSLLVGAGFLAGVINTIAGSGSVFTLSALIWFGLPGNMANGTNRIGILGQSLIAGWVYIRSGAFVIKDNILPLLAAVIGASAGSVLATRLSTESFRWVIIAVMSLMFLIILFKPAIRKSSDLKVEPPWYIVSPVMFGIGFYGGFIQMGMGVITLVVLIDLIGFSYARANGLKLVMTLFFSAPVLLIYHLNNQVEWGLGLALLAGQLPGAYLSSRFLIKQTGFSTALKVLLLVIIVVTLIKLIF